MQVVIADTGPINYLILIEQIDLLPRLWGKIVFSTIVQAELADRLAPVSVRRWIAAPPDWLRFMSTPETSPVPGLHKGEIAAIELALLSRPICCLSMIAGASSRPNDKAFA